jgi:hypothetical protein
VEALGAFTDDVIARDAERDGTRRYERGFCVRSNKEDAVANSFKVGQAVTWQWSGNDAHGKVAERFDRKVQRTLKGSKIVRNGSKDDPAYLVEQEDGAKALKLGSELTAG